MKKEKNENKNKKFALLIGAVAGVVNGIFGGGGGMLVVPMLVMLLNCPPKKAHATALIIILPLSLVSGIIYAIFGNLNVNIATPVSIGVVLGGVLGAFLLSKLSSKWVIIIFSLTMAIAGAKMLFF